MMMKRELYLNEYYLHSLYNIMLRHTHTHIYRAMTQSIDTIV